MERLYESESRLERSNHTAFIDANILYVWGGYQMAAGADLILPSEEIWECDLDSGEWVCRAIGGDAPPELSGPCGAFLKGSLYVFAGCDPVGYTNQCGFDGGMLYLEEENGHQRNNAFATQQTFLLGPQRQGCFHGDSLIYFGGYGCKTIQEVRSASAQSFVVEETSWSAIGTTYFRCWGWNNEVNIFDTQTNSWSMPETQGPAPSPRGCHASAVLGNRGFVCGGLDSKDIDMYCLDLDTWTWTCYDLCSARLPIGRSMHTLTPTSDHTLLLYGGYGANEVGVDPSRGRSDAWQFDTLTKEWLERADHPHHDKPRVWHSACRGEGGQVVVFGGSSDFCFQMDSVAVLRSARQQHCQDVFVFQNQPSSLSRLSEDAVARNQTLLTQQLSWLPRRTHKEICKRLAFFSSQQPGATTRHPGANMWPQLGATA